MQTSWQRARMNRWSRKIQSFRPKCETLEERTTPTSLLSVAALPNPITDYNAPGTFTMRLVFDGSMNPSVAPAITFPTSGESPGASLAFTTGFFTSTNFFNDTFIARFAASDRNVLVPDIDVRVSGARDFLNTVVDAQTVPDVFSIDTQHPIVASFVVNKPAIVKADIGSNFVITVTYREAMSTDVDPTISFSQNVSNNLTFTSGEWNANGTVFTAVYKISGKNITVASINVNVSGARNAAGFEQLTHTVPNAFSINTRSNADAVFPVGSSARVTGDFNGDGLSDVAAFYSSSGRWLVALSTGTSFLAPQSWAKLGSGAGIKTFLVGDFNNDGKDDIAYFYNPTGAAQWRVFESTGGAFTAKTWANLKAFGTTGWKRHLLGDFNGDGYLDIASFRSSTAAARWFVHASTGATFTTRMWGNLTPISRVGWNTAVAGDFNDDGKTDIANFYRRNGVARWWVSTSSGIDFTTTNFGNMPTADVWTNQMAGDFNNDGRADLVSFNPAANQWWVSLSNGTAFTTTQWLALTPFGSTLQEVADFNNDGKDDLGVLDRGSGQFVVGASTGANFAASIWQTLSTFALKDQLVGDFNGDGKPDLAYFYATSAATQWWVSINTIGSFTLTQWR